MSEPSFAWLEPCPKGCGAMKRGPEFWVCPRCVSVVPIWSDSAPHGITREQLATLPTVLALPLRKYLDERENPTLKLWAACDAVEILLRFFIAAGIADLARIDALPAKTAANLGQMIVRPTLPEWRVMASTVAQAIRKAAREKPVLKELPDTFEAFKELLPDAKKDAEKKHSLVSIRNRLAHVRFTRKEALELVTALRPRFEKALARLEWLSGLSLVAKGADGTCLDLRGWKEPPDPFVPGSRVLQERLELQLRSPGSVTLVANDHVLPLWPLITFGLPRLPDPQEKAIQPVVQVYIRRGNVQLEYLPLGSREALQSLSSDAAYQRFLKLFRLHEGGGAIAGMMGEMVNDSQELVGRADQIELIETMVSEAFPPRPARPEPRLFCLTGQAGLGKSCLMARVVMDLTGSGGDSGLEPPLGDVVVVPYRFNAKQPSCSRASFLSFALEQLRLRLGTDRFPWLVDDDRAGDPLTRLREVFRHLGEARVLVIVDGLDDIGQSDPLFGPEVILPCACPGAVLLVAGRPEKEMAELLDHPAAVHLFQGDLPKMSVDDVRAMILLRIGPAREKLLKQEKASKEADRIDSPFVEKVTTLAQGLPLYVAYVIGDIVGKRYSTLDVGERLPRSLTAYHEELLRRHGIGVFQQMLTPLACHLTLALEPMTAAMLAEILVYRNVLLANQKPAQLVNEGLAALQSMFRTSPLDSGEVGYVVYHTSFRDHLNENPETSGAMTTAIRVMAELAAKPGPVGESLARYFGKWGANHLKDGRHWLAAKA